MANFYDTITEAIRDIEAHGFDSEQRITRWIGLIEQAAKDSMMPEHVVNQALSGMMQGIYKKMIERAGIMKMHKGISRFTIDRLSPKLRNELDRRIMASAQLIKLNRQQAIAQTIQRFSGWASSIPAGGSKAVDVMDVKANLKKSFSAQTYEYRRVAIDQGHKLVASLNEIIAVDGGAIAGEWNSHWRQKNYSFRPDHKARDGKVYAIRGNWALEKGLMTKGAGYYDDMTAAGEEPFCRCSITWIHNLRDLPESMLTAKGEKAIEAARMQ